jgi:hypothetical protein
MQRGAGRVETRTVTVAAGERMTTFAFRSAGTLACVQLGFAFAGGKSAQP